MSVLNPVDAALGKLFIFSLIVRIESAGRINIRTDLIEARAQKRWVSLTLRMYGGYRGLNYAMRSSGWREILILGMMP